MKQIILAIVLISSILAQNNLSKSLQDLCLTLFDLVGTLAMVMVLMSSMAYAAGQMLGAEMRARAVVWSQSMLTGAFIGVIMIILVPAVLAVMLGLNSFDAQNCQFQ